MRWLSILVVGLGVFTASVGPAAGAPAVRAPASSMGYQGLAPTPPMGFNPWVHYDPNDMCGVNEQLMREAARAMVGRGLKAAGYEYFNLDDCWADFVRNPDGTLRTDPRAFPSGIPALASYVHALGLKFGIYSSPGYFTCQGRTGSKDHESQDAQTFAAWGIDFLKYDVCGSPTVPALLEDRATGGTSGGQQLEQDYVTMSAALRATGRSIVFSMEAPFYAELFGSPNDFTDTMDWVGQYGQMWRTTFDISDSYSSWLSNYEGNEPLWRYAKPGNWNDPDMIPAGGGGQSDLEYRSQFTVWSEMAAPLLLSADFVHMRPEILKIVTDRDVIAIDQDPLGVQGHVVARAGAVDILTKPLANGDVAVVLFDRGDNPAAATASPAQYGLAGHDSYAIRDLWSKVRTIRSTGAITRALAPHEAVIYRVSVVPAGSPSTGRQRCRTGRRRRRRHRSHRSRAGTGLVRCRRRAPNRPRPAPGRRRARRHR